MAETYGLSCCSSALVPKINLLHNSEEQHGFILKLSHPIGKNNKGMHTTYVMRILHEAQKRCWQFRPLFSAPFLSTAFSCH